MLESTDPIAGPFWTHVDRKGPDDCWLWSRCTNSGGYGHYVRHGQRYLAHRVAWERTHGTIPAGSLVLHKCDVRRCCNPAHLFLGDHAENSADMVRKGRGGDTRHKLNFEKAQEIRELRAGGVKMVDLARRYGVTKESIHAILSGRSYPVPRQPVFIDDDPKELGKLLDKWCRRALVAERQRDQLRVALEAIVATHVVAATVDEVNWEAVDLRSMAASALRELERPLNGLQATMVVFDEMVEVPPESP